MDRVLETAHIKATRRIVLVVSPEHRQMLTSCLINTQFPDGSGYQYYWHSHLRQIKPQSPNSHHDTLIVSADYLENQGSPELVNYLQSSAVICLYDAPPLDPERLLRMGIDEFLPVNKLSVDTLNFAMHTVRYRHDKPDTEKPIRLDEVTGLPGRGSFEHYLQQVLDDQTQDAEQQTGGPAVFLVSLKGLDHLTNHYGMKIGDQVLLRVRERIQRTVGNRTFVARMSMNEFGVVLGRVNVAVELSRIAIALLETISIPIILGKETAVLGCNIGIAQFGRAGEDADTLIKSSAIALKNAQAEVQDTFKFYSKEMELESRGRFMLEKQLRLAIPANEMELFYQPRMDIQANTVVGAEALIRWNHPEKGLLSPDLFIPLAEETGLIIELGYWILERACQDWLALSEWGVRDIHLAINLSFKQFYDPDLVDKVRAIIGRYPIDASRIEFELTESTVLHDEQKVLDAMEALSRDGIRFSLDDFGTGYSSFAHIAELPITLLKVDKSFVMGMDSQVTRAEIVESIIYLAHRLNLEVVGEGIENASQKNRLVDMNCDQGQGYLFARPLPFVDLCAYLANEQTTR